MIDFTSILLGSAISGFGLTVTLLSVWMSARQSDYVLTMAIGIMLLVVHIVAFWQYGQNPNQFWGQGALILLVAGFDAVTRAGNQFLRRSQPPAIRLASIVVVVVSAFLMASGLDGVGFILSYLMVSVLLAQCGLAFRDLRLQNRNFLKVVSLLTGTGTVSFALCALVLLWNREWSIGTTPDNWAEQLNSALAVVFMTSLGALTLTMHHSRKVDALLVDSMTDPLTGLLNRRALEKMYGEQTLGEHSAVALFDLDQFKQTNDVFGHPVGDLVLKRFADVLRLYQRQTVEAFRLGGEEFALLMRRVTPEEAHSIAERVGIVFGAEVVPTELGPLSSSVSAGVACGTREGARLKAVIGAADEALYEAKRAGRNRTVLHRGPAILTDTAATTSAPAVIQAA